VRTTAGPGPDSLGAEKREPLWEANKAGTRFAIFAGRGDLQSVKWALWNTLPGVTGAVC
jgi:hypothetical protein